MISAVGLINTGSNQERKISAGGYEAYLDRPVWHSGIDQRSWMLCSLSHFQQTFPSSLILFNAEKNVVVSEQDVGH